MILNIDLLNFFPSITTERMCMLLLSPPYAMDPAVAITITQLCCPHGCLLQGAPASPVRANRAYSQLTGASEESSLVS
jgi:RNA-directed DNA polymerase